MEMTIDVTAKSQLERLESEIEEGLTVIYQVGAKLQRALAEIRDQQLWKDVTDALGNPVYQTFEHYCQVRWHSARQTINDHALAGRVAAEMLAAGSTESDIPQRTSQLLALRDVEPDLRTTVLQQAREVNGGRVTASAIERIKKVLKPEVGKSYRVVDERNPECGQVIAAVNLVGGMVLDERDVPFLPAELESLSPEPPQPQKPSLRERSEHYRALLARTLACSLPDGLRAEIETALA